MRELLQSPLVALASMIISGQVAAASGTGLITFGDPMPAVKSSAGLLQLVELRPFGSLLVGKPAQGSVALITMYAPGHQGGRLVLREKEFEHGATLLHFSVPTRLQANLVRATVFVHTTVERVRLAHASDGHWVDLSPQEIILAGGKTSDAGASKMMAFPIDQFGLFQLVSRRSESLGPIHGEPAGIGTLGTGARVSRAGWHFIWPALLLMVAAAVSKYLHQTGPRLQGDE